MEHGAASRPYVKVRSILQPLRVLRCSRHDGLRFLFLTFCHRVPPTVLLKIDYNRHNLE